MDVDDTAYFVLMAHAASLSSGKAMTWIIPFSVSIALKSFVDKP